MKIWIVTSNKLKKVYAAKAFDDLCEANKKAEELRAQFQSSTVAIQEDDIQDHRVLDMINNTLKENGFYHE